MDDSGDGHAILDFFIDDTVSADNHGAALFYFIGASLENLTEHADVHLSFRKANDVQTCFRLATHGINIAQRVSSGDLAKKIRVVNNRSKKIHRVHDGEIRTQTKHPCVVGGFGPDQHIGVIEFGQFVQNLHEVGGAELGG